RQITPQDQAAIEAVITQVMTEFDTIGPGYSINDTEMKNLYQAYHNERSLYLILEEDNQIIGGGGIAPLAGGDPEVCELKKMYFLPAARGKGYGRQMLEHLLTAARTMDYKTCYLETVTRMEAAKKLYLKMGFEPLCSAMGNTGHSACEAYYSKKLI
ncbi:MAG: GNAT family N-acetyltransferase, partial [Bacteroidota bacterium]